MMTTMAFPLRQDVRVGIQIIIEGEKLEVQELLTKISLFLRYAIPALTTLSTIAGFVMAVVGGIEDTLITIRAPLGLISKQRELLIIYIGLCLVGILIGAMVKK